MVVCDVMKKKSGHCCNCPCHQHCTTKCRGTYFIYYYFYLFVTKEKKNKLNCQIFINDFLIFFFRILILFHLFIITF